MNTSLTLTKKGSFSVMEYISYIRKNPSLRWYSCQTWAACKNSHNVKLLQKDEHKQQPLGCNCQGGPHTCPLTKNYFSMLENNRIFSFLYPTLIKSSEQSQFSTFWWVWTFHMKQICKGLWIKYIHDLWNWLIDYKRILL